MRQGLELGRSTLIAGQLLKDRRELLGQLLAAVTRLPDQRGQLVQRQLPRLSLRLGWRLPGPLGEQGLLFGQRLPRGITW